VTAIGAGAFEANLNLVSVTIPNGVTTIGADAFYGSASLTQVVIGTGVTNIGNEAFAENAALGSATFLRLTAPTMGENVFALNGAAPSGFVVRYIQGATGYGTPTWTPANNPAYTTAFFSESNGFLFQTANGTATITGYTGSNASVVIPSTIGGLPVRAIGNTAFQNNLVVTSVTIPSSVTTIGNGTFSGVTNLAAVTIGSGVTSIGTDAFYDCDALTAVAIPAGVNFIGLGAFGSCDGLTAIDVAAGNPKYSSLGGVLFNKLQTTLLQYPGGLVGATYTIPPSVTTIGARSFEENTTLVSMTIPNTVTSIGENAFDGSQLLYDLTIGTGVTSIGNAAFANIGTLNTALFLRNEAPSVPAKGAPNGIFTGNLTINYFEGAGNYTTGNWTSYIATAVSESNGFTYALANGNTTITITGYTGTNGTVVIPSTIGSLPVRTVGDNAFQNNLVVTSVTLPNSVTAIGNGTFSGATNLASVTIGSGVTSIGSQAFMGSGINTISIPAGVATIGLGAFENCQSLATILVASNNPNYSSLGGVLYNRSQSSLVSYPTGAALNNFTIPSTVRTIETGAFKYNLNLNLVEIPSGVLTINSTAFQFSQSLISVRFASGNQTIGAFAFANIPTLGSAIFYGNAPDAQANSFAGASADFKIYYLAGASGFTNPGQKAWVSGYQTAQIQSLGNFEFTTLNGTVEITGFTGTPPGPGDLAQLVPDLTTRPVPNFVGVSNDLVFGISNIPNPLVLPAGYLVYDTTTDMIWEFVQYLYNSNRVISNWEWRVYNTNNARLNLNPNVSLGTTVIEQDNVGPVIYQKVANPGSSLESWIPVNFEIPDTIAGLPVTSIAAGALANQKLLQSVVLPDSLTRLGAGAFSGCDELGTLGLVTEQRGVFIPGPVNQIGAAPFVGCQKLQSLFVHSSNPSFTAIDGVLYNKNQSNLIQYPAGKLGMEFTLPSAVTSILQSAFEGNRYLALLQTGNNLTAIGDRAFFGSQVLAQARFGNGLKALGNSSFSSIPSLGSAIFSGNWLGNYTFGSDVFYRASDNFVVNYYPGAPGFTSPTWTVSGQTYDSAIVNFIGDFQFSTANGSATITGYRGAGGTVNIPSTLQGNPVRAIADLVFAGNDNIVSVAIPSSVTSIGNRTFAEAVNLQSIDLGTGLVSIGTEAFFDCDALTSVTVPAGVNAIGLGAFGTCNSLASITVAAGNPVYSSLGGVLFNKLQSKIVQYPGGLPSATYQIPATVTTIGERAFELNATLASLTTPPTLTTIEDSAFEGSQLLYEVTFGTGVTSLGNSSFANIATLAEATFLRLTAPTLPAGVFDNAAPGFTVYYMPGASGYTTGNWTAYNPTVLSVSDSFEFQTTNGSVTITDYTGTNATVVIPATIGGAPVRAIGNNVFKDNLVITSVTIPSTVASIGEEAFAGTENLASINLGTGLTTIRTDAFRGSGLISIDLPAGVSTIEDGAFADCFNLAAINVSDSNPKYSSTYSVLSGSNLVGGSGVLFNKNRTELILYPMAKGGFDFIVPGTVKKIMPNAFEGNLNLVTVEFPDNVEEVRDRAFYNSQSLVSIRFGEDLVSLGSESFAAIQSLNQAVFLGNAPDGSANVFTGASSSFRILYLGGRSGFVGTGAKAWLAGYTLMPFGDDGVFEFTSANGTVEITGYIGVPPLPDQPPQVEPDFDARPLPNIVVANAAQRTSFAFVPRTFPVGSYVLQEDTNTLWINIGLNVSGTAWVWEVLTTDDARLTLPTATSLGATILEQDIRGPIVYQKISNPGTNPDNWIRVNFEIPATIAGLPVTSIGTAAFANNKLLQSVVIPPSVTKIGENAFLNCEQLGQLGQLTEPKGVFIPAAVNQIGTGAFGRCRSLENLFVHTSNPVFTSQAGVLYTKNLSELRQYPVGKLGIEFTTPTTLRTIAERAFEGNRFLALITISPGVETIGKQAFFRSMALAQARIGAGVKNIGEEAFADIPSLGSAVFAGNAPVPPTGSFGANVFIGASDNFEVNYFVGAEGYNIVDGEWIVPDNPPYPIDVVKVSGDYEFKIENGGIVITAYLGNGGAVQIPSSLGSFPVRSIGDTVFAGNDNVTSVTIPSSITSIGDNAFSEALQLATVNFGNGLVSIGEEAFYGCISLASVNLPAGLFTIGTAAFGNCENLTAINVNQANLSFTSLDGVLFNKNLTKLIQYPGGLTEESYNISAQTVGERAFERNTALVSLVFADSVETIESRAFYGMAGLSQATIGTDVSTIGSEAFANCATFGKAKFLGYVAPAVGSDAFDGVRADFEIEYFEGAIGFDVAPWTSFTATVLPPTTPSGFTYEVNGGTVEITGFTGSDLIGTIQDYYSVPGQSPDYTVPTAEARRDLYWELYNVNGQGVPNGTIVLQTDNNTLYRKVSGSGYFESNWEPLTAQGTLADLPPNLPIGTVAFVGSNARFYQKISNSGDSGNDWNPVNFQVPSEIDGMPVVAIADGAFDENSNITSVALPSSLTKIGSKAFYKTNLLRKLFIPAGVSTIGTQAFANAGQSFTEFVIHPNNAAFSTKSGVLFTKDQKTLRQYPEGRFDLSYEVPATVTQISAYAFEGTRNLVSIDIPDGVTSIGDGAFYGSVALSQVNIGTGVSSIGNQAFAQNAALGTAILRRQVAPTMGSNVFAFNGSAPVGLVIRYIPGGTGYSTPTWQPANNPAYAAFPLSQEGDFEFEILNGQATITGYIGFGGAIQIPSEIGGFPVRSIGANAFKDNSTITSVLLPSTLTTIGEGAFYNCNGIQFIEIPANVNTIGAKAFASCDSLLGISVNSANREFASDTLGVLFTKDKTDLLQYPIGLSELEYEITDTVTRVAEEAFLGSKSLEKIYFGKNVQTLETLSFAEMPALVSAVFYGKAPNLGANVFKNASPEFEVQYVPGSGTVAGATPFPTNPLGGIWNGYTAVPVSNIDDFEFTKVTGGVRIDGYEGNPASIRFEPDFVPVVPNQVVDDAAERQTLPPGLPNGWNVLELSTNLVWTTENVTATSNNWNIKTSTNNSTEMAQGGFLLGRLLLDTTLPVGTTYKEQSASQAMFYQKVAMPGTNESDWIRISTHTLRIPETLAGLPVVSIKDEAFKGLITLQSVVFPNSLKTIGNRAFASCSILGLPNGFAGNNRGIFIPAGVSSIGAGAFASCGSLSEIRVNSANKAYAQIDGVLLNKAQTQLLQYPGGRFNQSYTLPSRITTIANYAFEGTAYLENVEIPASCTEIGAGAFQDSVSLATITVGSGVKKVGDLAFANISGLESITFKGNAPSLLGANVFENLSSSAKIQFNARSTGFNIAPWTSLNLVPVWMSAGSPTSSGFRAFGYVEPADFNNNIGGQFQISVSRSRVATGVLMLGTAQASRLGFSTGYSTTAAAGGIVSYRFSGVMNDTGGLTVSIARRGQTNLELNLQFDLLDAPVFFKLRNGSVVSDGTSTAAVTAGMIPWSSAVSAQPFAGNYNMAFDADPDGQNIAPGMGFAGLAVDARTGAARLTGVLGDGTRFTGASWVLGDGSIPVWFPLYTNKGMLVGDLLLGSGGSSLSADLLWSKPPGVPRSPDPLGFDDVILTASAGSGRFVAPSISAFSNFSLDFQGETGSGVSFSQGFTLDRSRIVPVPPNSNQVRAAWNLRGGLVQGTCTLPTGQVGRFQGIILSDGKIHGNFVLPNSPTRPTVFYGGSVNRIEEN
jgi:hypothetical protein